MQFQFQYIPVANSFHSQSANQFSHRPIKTVSRDGFFFWEKLWKTQYMGFFSGANLFEKYRSISFVKGSLNLGWISIQTTPNILVNNPHLLVEPYISQFGIFYREWILVTFHSKRIDNPWQRWPSQTSFAAVHSLNTSFHPMLFQPIQQCLRWKIMSP